MRSDRASSAVGRWAQRRVVFVTYPVPPRSWSNRRVASGVVTAALRNPTSDWSDSKGGTLATIRPAATRCAAGVPCSRGRDMTTAESLAAWGAYDRDNPFPVFAAVRQLAPVHPVTLAD